jgi:hypothetical protein
VLDVDQDSLGKQAIAISKEKKGTLMNAIRLAHNSAPPRALY